MQANENDVTSFLAIPLNTSHIKKHWRGAEVTSSVAKGRGISLSKELYDFKRNPKIYRVTHPYLSNLYNKRKKITKFE